MWRWRTCRFVSFTCTQFSFFPVSATTQLFSFSWMWTLFLQTRYSQRCVPVLDQLEDVDGIFWGVREFRDVSVKMLLYMYECVVLLRCLPPSSHVASTWMDLMRCCERVCVLDSVLTALWVGENISMPNSFPMAEIRFNVVFLDLPIMFIVWCRYICREPRVSTGLTRQTLRALCK